MDAFKETLYDVMGITRDAGPHEIGRAWNRYRATARAETTPPDPRREAVMRHAYETLSDPYRRAAYDASLRRQSPVLQATRRAPAKTGAIALLVVGALAGAAYYVHRSQLPPPRTAAGGAPVSVADIRDSLTRAVGRVQLIGIDGRESTRGIAFAIEEGVMATPCEGLSPASQPIILAPPRRWPARVTGMDGQGICRLDVHGGAAFPLRLTRELPRPGARVFTVDVAPTGETQMREAQVTRVAGGASLAIETNVPVPANGSGRPLLDADGRVVAVGLASATGPGRYVPIPKAWLPVDSPPEVSPPRRREPDSTGRGSPRPAPANISPERQQRLQEAFHPPPTVPDDL